MVKHDKQDTADEKIKPNENSAARNFISKPFSKRFPIQNSSNDDLIVWLSDAYENQRARQVFEWEKIRRQHGYFGA